MVIHAILVLSGSHQTVDAVIEEKSFVKVIDIAATETVDMLFYSRSQ